MRFNPQGKQEGSVAWPVRLVFQFWAGMLLKKARKVSNQRGALQVVLPGLITTTPFVLKYMTDTVIGPGSIEPVLARTAVKEERISRAFAEIILAAILTLQLQRWFQVSSSFRRVRFRWSR